MKKKVIEMLEERGLSHLYSEGQFNSYRSKINKQFSGNNGYLKALNIFDMFILNG